MNAVREAYLQAVDGARAVLAAPRVAARWDQPSALPEFSIRGLAGHLARGATTVAEYLAAPEPDAEPISAAAYFAALQPAPDVHAPQQAAIRQRGEDVAAHGPAALLDTLDTTRAALAQALEAAPPSRKLAVMSGVNARVIDLDGYLLTRMVELLVHIDDLAVSAGIEPPAPPPAASELTLHYLLDVARARTGDAAVLRAFSRRERDPLQALRVF